MSLKINKYFLQRIRSWENASALISCSQAHFFDFSSDIIHSSTTASANWPLSSSLTNKIVYALVFPTVKQVIIYAQRPHYMNR